MTISISWYLVAKSAVIRLLCRNPSSSLKCLFYFALYNLWLFVHITGIFGDICSGKLEKNTFHNQSADNIPLEPWNYKGFLPLILKTSLFRCNCSLYREFRRRQMIPFKVIVNSIIGCVSITRPSLQEKRKNCWNRRLLLLVLISFLAVLNFQLRFYNSIQTTENFLYLCICLWCQ